MNALIDHRRRSTTIVTTTTTSTHNNDVESPFKSPTNRQQHHDQQTQRQQSTTSNNHELRHSITTTTNDSSNHNSRHGVGHHFLWQPVGSSRGQAHPPVCAPPERKPFSGVPDMVLELKTAFMDGSSRAQILMHRHVKAPVPAETESGAEPGGMIYRAPPLLNVAGTGNSDPQQPHGQRSKILPVLNQEHQERKDQETM